MRTSRGSGLRAISRSQSRSWHLPFLPERSSLRRRARAEIEGIFALQPAAPETAAIASEKTEEGQDAQNGGNGHEREEPGRPALSLLRRTKT